MAPLAVCSYAFTPSEPRRGEIPTAPIALRDDASRGRGGVETTSEELAAVYSRRRIRARRASWAVVEVDESVDSAYCSPVWKKHSCAVPLCG